MKTVNPKHAPKDHKAVAHASGLPCDGCAFRLESLCPNVRGVSRCTKAHRPDGQHVIFVKA